MVLPSTPTPSSADDSTGQDTSTVATQRRLGFLHPGREFAFSKARIHIFYAGHLGNRAGVQQMVRRLEKQDRKNAFSLEILSSHVSAGPTLWFRTATSHLTLEVDPTNYFYLCLCPHKPVHLPVEATKRLPYSMGSREFIWHFCSDWLIIQGPISKWDQILETPSEHENNFFLLAVSILKYQTWQLS